VPCLPIKTDKLPSGCVWLHEIRHDGFRVIARKTGAPVKPDVFKASPASLGSRPSEPRCCFAVGSASIKLSPWSFRPTGTILSGGLGVPHRRLSSHLTTGLRHRRAATSASMRPGKAWSRPATRPFFGRNLHFLENHLTAILIAQRSRSLPA
jgi:hypothetical protein